MDFPSVFQVFNYDLIITQLIFPVAKLEAQ